MAIEYRARYPLMSFTEATVLHRPESAELRFLPEGPQHIGGNVISWVAIQHGGDADFGSINTLDIETGESHSYKLHGRPGFAFPTETEHEFLAGIERHICLVNVKTGESEELSDVVDSDVEGTIINDGEPCEQGVIFGSKDLKFAEEKAGLYLWRKADNSLLRLRNDQICSNGKAVLGSDQFLDIDTPTRKIVRYQLDSSAGTVEAVGEIDLSQEPGFPDGMVGTPDGKSVIVAYYNPELGDNDFGEARQYSIETGQHEYSWHTPRATQVTCPLLLETANGTKLILTTAVEHMSVDNQAILTNSGCLFIADTPF